MSKLRWSKLWWADWENDPALRLCSLAAQGLWMRCLCLAANADPYGHVLVAGKPPSIAQLARIVGAQGSQVRNLIAELERNGVLSRSDRGAIVSRRMVRDGAEHATKSRVGSLGGNPALGRVQNPNPPSGNGLDNQADKRVDKVEAEAHAEAESPPLAPPRGGRAPRWKNGMAEVATEMMGDQYDAAAVDPRPSGARVVGFPRRA
jgi:hypothetical protein